MTYRVDVTLTDGRHRSPIIVAASPDEAVSRAYALTIGDHRIGADRRVVQVTHPRRWVAL